MEKFKHEERLLGLITESTREMYSITELSFNHTLTCENLLNKPKFKPFFLEANDTSLGNYYLESIFLYDEDIYIYLSKSEPMISSFSCKIYYPIKKQKDVGFFILNLKKIKKDGN
jgi:hypothetical protein